jgi:ribonuclease-3
MSDELSRKLGYQFNNPQLLKVALTHRSCNEENNERLEFLGDSIVNFVIADALYHQFTNAQEGELSRWRASLINREALGDLGRHFELGRYIFLGQGELKSGGSQRISILSCTMEAIIGAIYLDGGFEITKTTILHWYENLLSSLSNAASHKDPKTQLQEYLQAQQIALPVYTVEAVDGEAHQQTFKVSCKVAVLNRKVFGNGSSRRRAEQTAAQSMLGLIKK